MPQTKWLDRTQPPTLINATILLYINAVYGLLFGAFFSPIGLVLTIGDVLAGWGIANEKKALYWVGVAIATLNVVTLLSYRSFSVVISLLFAIALLALLLHPMSRSYRRTWFR